MLGHNEECVAVDLTKVIITELSVLQFFQQRGPIASEFLVSGDSLLRHLAKLMDFNGLTLNKDVTGKYSVSFLSGTLYVDKHTGVVTVTGNMGI